MRFRKTHTLLLLLLSLSSLTYAQRGNIELGVRVGNNATFGNFSAVTIEAEHNFGANFSLKGGILQSSYGRFVTEARPTYSRNVGFGTLHFEGLVHYTAQSNHNTYALGGGVGLTTSHFFATVGYYYRTLGNATDRINEPFNLYYKFGVSCLEQIEDWDLLVTFSNSHPLELERHYQPSLTIDGWWHLSERLGATLGVSYKPTGIFHISTTYYQLFANFGVCYKW
jgi:hypothetical protein